MNSSNQRSTTRHADTIERLTNLLQADEDVVTLALYGSALEPERLDLWSDVDAFIVVQDDAMARFFPSTDWLAPLGTPFAKEQFAGEPTRTTRICFEDLRKLDLVLTTRSEAQRIDTWSQVPFVEGARICFSRDQEITQRLNRRFPRPTYAPMTHQAFEALADAFWFRAMVAVSKVARDDLVIALHLALSLLQDGCLLAMLLRDRAEGTTVHRTGGMANEIVATFTETAQPPTADGILNLIVASGRIFDRLAGIWSTAYRPKMAPLSAAVARARAERDR